MQCDLCKTWLEPDEAVWAELDGVAEPYRGKTVIADARARVHPRCKALIIPCSQNQARIRLHSMDPSEVCKTIRSELRRRSGKAWSVKHGRGTSWGCITVSSAPSDRIEYGHMSERDRRHLADLLGLELPVHSQGWPVPAGYAYYRVALARAITGTALGFTTEEPFG